MDKNTVIAVVLCTVIVSIGMLLTQVVNEKYAPPQVVTPPQVAVEEEIDSIPEAKISRQDEPASIPEISPKDFKKQEYEKKTIVEETDVFKIVFNTEGGIASDIYLVKEFDKGEPVSMVLDGDKNIGTFNMSFGGPQDPYIKEVFDHRRIKQRNLIIHEFSRDFQNNGRSFSLIKRYHLVPDEYLVELVITLKTSDGKAVPLLNSEKDAYTLTYGPQIGPKFKKLDGRYEIREFVSWGPDPRSGKIKRRAHKNRNKVVSISNAVTWAGVVGKYFAIIATPGSGNSTITWDGRPVEGQIEPSLLQISRPARRQSVIEDTYRFYIGPLEKGNLRRYDSAEDNAFGLSGVGFENAPRTSALLGWLESLLRILLEFFFKLIPNYGVSIILLTVLVKIILYPFTHKSYESTSKMQGVQPKIKEIQERYKGDPQKINTKTAELYKAEGINPMGGCLPMLFQFPIFIALYGLLNRYFPLRGAGFIQGWITDLSAPEFVWREFYNPINLLIVNIPAIRILPVLYLIGQLLMTRVTKQGPTGGQTGMQQKMLTLGLPIMFFFILYNMPSGLLLYWTAMNFITIGQQLITNYIKKFKSSGGSS